MHKQSEQDQGSEDEQASVIHYLGGFLKLVLVVHSGGKSLHGWFYVEGLEIGWFMNVACQLGADNSMRSSIQLARMPDGTRENGQRQRIIYFDPVPAALRAVSQGRTARMSIDRMLLLMPESERRWGPRLKRVNSQKYFPRRAMLRSLRCSCRKLSWAAGLTCAQARAPYRGKPAAMLIDLAGQHSGAALHGTHEADHHYESHMVIVISAKGRKGWAGDCLRQGSFRFWIRAGRTDRC